MVASLLFKGKECESRKHAEKSREIGENREGTYRKK